MQIGSTSPVAAVLNEGHSSINTESTDRFGRQPATHSPRLRTALIVAGLCPASYSQAAVHRSERRLRQSFTAPPDSARPWVWWHWINGNVTEEGIGLDLEWMSRVGIHGIMRAGYARARRFKYVAIHCRRDTKAEASKCRQLKVVTVLELTAAIKAGETAVSNSSGHAFFGGNVDEILLHRFVEI